MKKDKEEVAIFEKVKEEELPTPVFVDLVKEPEPLKEEETTMEVEKKKAEQRIRLTYQG